jgi:hypothetical protein
LLKRHASHTPRPCWLRLMVPYGRQSSPIRILELIESFFSFLDHIVEHVDDVVVALAVVLHDPVDGDLELLDVPGDLRNVLVDVMRVLGLLLLLEVDIPFCYLLFVLLVLHVDIPLSSVLSNIVPLADFMILSILVPLSDLLGRGGDDWCRGRTGRAGRGGDDGNRGRTGRALLLYGR